MFIIAELLESVEHPAFAITEAGEQTVEADRGT